MTQERIARITTKSISLALVLVLTPVACTRFKPKKPAEAAHLDKKEYSKLLGVIANLPTGKDPRIVICHGAIQRVGPNGEDEPSNPALMPFWLGANAKVNGLKEGDRIQFDLETDWDTETPVLITVINKLDESSKAHLSCP